MKSIFKQLKKSLEQVKNADDLVLNSDGFFKLKWYDYPSIWWSRYIIDSYYWIRNFLFHRYDLIRTGLSKGHWCDKVDLMLYGIMGLVVDFVEKEECFEIINWESEEEHRHAGQEIKAIYAWWKNYPNRQKEIEDKLSEWHNKKFGKSDDISWIEKLNEEDSEKAEKAFKELHQLEGKLYEEEQEYLKRAIEIRPYLWT